MLPLKDSNMIEIIKASLISMLLAALVVNGVAWYLQAPLIWYLSAAAGTLLTTIIHVKSLTNDMFLEQSILCMKQTECCCIHNCWKNPRSIIMTTALLRSLAGTMATIACGLSYVFKDEFFEKKYFTITLLWSMAVGLWIASCIPFAIGLVQCAAEDTTTNPKPIKIGKETLANSGSIEVNGKIIKLAKGQDIIVRFRQVISMLLLHDIVIGIFWMYLALMLYDLTDDQDDSNWRTIFLSMISWHIVFQTFYHIYLKNVWSCTIISQKENASKACCAPSQADKWWSILQLSGLAAVYVATIIRMGEINITDMGCTVETLIYIIYGSGAFCIGKYMITREIHGREIHSIKRGKSKRTWSLLPTNTKLHF